MNINLNALSLWVGVALVAYTYGGWFTVGFVLIVQSLLSSTISLLLRDRE